jgi:hypothetical protein
MMAFQYKTWSYCHCPLFCVYPISSLQAAVEEYYVHTHTQKYVPSSCPFEPLHSQDYNNVQFTIAYIAHRHLALFLNHTVVRDFATRENTALVQKKICTLLPTL